MEKRERVIQTSEHGVICHVSNEGFIFINKAQIISYSCFEVFID